MTSSNTAPQVAPHGSWASPLTAQALAGARVRFDDLRHVDGRLYWTETLPDEGGSVALLSLAVSGAGDATTTNVSPKGANVRTRVHEYGGAPYVVAGGIAYYSRFDDQRLYAVSPGGAAAVTPPGYRYADCVPAPATGPGAGALIGVREDHTEPTQVRNSLVRLPLPGGGAGEVLFGESDFVAYPRISPDGRRLAFITWNHPHMPWSATELKVAELTDLGIRAVTIAGGEAESVLDPQWDSDGTLYFISDRSGFWNLYAHRAGQQAVWPLAAEFANPLWLLGQTNYALLGGRAVVRYGDRGRDRLAVVDLARGTRRVLDLPYVEFRQITRIDASQVAVLAGSATAPQAILRIDVDTAAVHTLRSAGRAVLEPEAVSVATAIDFPSAQGRTAHALFYAPVNPRFHAPPDALPPLLTLVHGGPTGQASPAFAAAIQFWTSRGFAVLDVDYGGSSGFGRAYRQTLNGQWGVVDVEDVIAAARHLSRTGRADLERTAIRGGSAGGYTVLVALCTSEVFRAGADYYGVSDMTALARDTHKFESRYLDSLIGPLPEAQAVYEQRSPLNHLEGFKAPLIVFQGADDPIVPVNQSALIVESLRERGAPVAYIVYPGEGHGFRKPENTIHSLQSELSFYGQVFGFEPADRLPALAIDNLAPRMG